MKYFHLFTSVLLLNTIQLLAQTTDVITGITQPTSVVVDGNDIYYGLYEGSLFKADIASPQNRATVIPSSAIYRTFLYGRDLYVSESLEGKISKIDISQSNPSPVDVITGIASPTGIFIQNDILYFGDYPNTLYKVNLVDSITTKKVISSGFDGIAGICMIGNDVYVTEFDGNKISKIDVTQSSPSPINVMTNLRSPTEVIVVDNNLLVSEFDANRVIEIDISGTTPIKSNLVTNISNPTGLFSSDNDLYISVFGENKIVKFESVISNTATSKSGIGTVRIFPNPTAESIQILGLNAKENYKLIDASGKQIMRGKISERDKISVQELPSGTYFLKVENGITLPIIKE